MTHTTFRDRINFIAEIQQANGKMKEFLEKIQTALSEQGYPLKKNTYHFLTRVLQPQTRVERTLYMLLFQAAYQAEVISSGSAYPVVRFATLMHDAGKPMVRAEDENGLVIFYNHEVAGARIAREVCDRFHFSKKERDKIVNLIRWHMFTVDENITDSAVRRFIRRVGLENVKDMIDLRIGDRLGSGTQSAESWRLKKFKERITSELNPPFSINDLVINGNDIMKELNIKPGPKIGEILQALFLEVDENLELNNKEYLIKRIHEMKS